MATLSTDDITVLRFVRDFGPVTLTAMGHTPLFNGDRPRAYSTAQRLVANGSLVMNASTKLVCSPAVLEKIK